MNEGDEGTICPHCEGYRCKVAIKMDEKSIKW